MYAAHKAAEGMTSIYRQIGTGCERLLRQILCDQLRLSTETASWSYTIPTSDGKTRKLTLDGRILLAEIKDKAIRQRVHKWMRSIADASGIVPSVFKSLVGTVFEVRQGYKSKDSKRQNADIANATTAIKNAYLPCAVILSSQIDGDLLLRYRAKGWTVLTGIVGLNDPLRSTYDFMSQVIEYDLAGFFQRNHKLFRAEIDNVLQTLLAPESP